MKTLVYWLVMITAYVVCLLPEFLFNFGVVPNLFDSGFLGWVVIFVSELVLAIVTAMSLYQTSTIKKENVL